MMNSDRKILDQNCAPNYFFNPYNSYNIVPKRHTDKLNLKLLIINKMFNLYYIIFLYYILDHWIYIIAKNIV